MRVFETVVPEELDGCRVETVLRRTLGLSVTRIKRAKFRPDGILLEGVRARTDQVVRAGQKLELHLPEQEISSLAPTPGAVDIVYEDPWLLAVNKPAGLPVHPGPGHYADTLGNRLTWLFRQRGEELVLRPVNRLDKGTSGLMLLAKSAQAHEALQGRLHTGAFCREYLALTCRAPSPAAGVVDAPIAPVEGALNRYEVRPSGKRAVTEYETVAVRPDGALLRLRLHTGRTHQIRVHMAYLGCPLLGDGAYGGAPVLDRPALHARRVRLEHPFTGETLALDAPLPGDLRSLGWEDVP